MFNWKLILIGLRSFFACLLCWFGEQHADWVWERNLRKKNNFTKQFWKIVKEDKLFFEVLVSLALNSEESAELIKVKSTVLMKFLGDFLDIFNPP